MIFKQSLILGIFQKRYKRFFADILVGDKILTAHTANTGAMKTCLGEGWPSLMSFHDSPTRKLKYSFEMIHNGHSWIGVNTSLTNKLAIEAINNGVIEELQGYKELKADDQGYCLFPDAVTERGLKHLGELLELRRQGVRTVMLYVVQREDCHSFKIEQSIDKAYCKKLKEVILEGVEVLVYQCKMSPEEIVVHKKLNTV